MTEYFELLLSSALSRRLPGYSLAAAASYSICTYVSARQTANAHVRMTSTRQEETQVSLCQGRLAIVKLKLY